MANKLSNPPQALAMPPQPDAFVWKALWVTFLFARVYFFEIGSLAYIYLPHAWVETPPGILPPSSGFLYQSLIGVWSHWDGFWYQSIALHGYNGRPTATAFFPLYPLLVHLLGSQPLAAMAVSVGSGAVAFWLLFRLIQIELGTRTAWLSTVVFAFFPTAFYTNAAYSESVFLALALVCLYLARRGHYLVAGIAGALATLDATYGLLLMAPLGWIIGQQTRWNWRKLFYTLLIPLGLVSYMVYLLATFGDPLVFEHAQSHWGRHFEWIPITLWHGLQAGWVHAAAAVSLPVLFHPGPPQLAPMDLYNFLFAMVGIVALVWAWPKLPGYLRIYGALALAVPFSYPAHGNPLMSMPRLLLEAFPVFPAIAIVLEQHSAASRWIYFAVSGLLGVLFVALFATAHWVA